MPAATTVKEVQAALVSWSVSFEAAAGRAPTDKDKQESLQYRQLQRQYKKLRGSSAGDGGGESRRRSASTRCAAWPSRS